MSALWKHIVSRPLFLFFINGMLTSNRVVFFERKFGWSIFLIFEREIHVTFAHAL